MRSELASAIVLTIACAALLGSRRLRGVDESSVEGEEITTRYVFF